MAHLRSRMSTMATPHSHYSRCPATFKALGRASSFSGSQSPDTPLDSWPVLPPSTWYDLEGCISLERTADVVLTLGYFDHIREISLPVRTVTTGHAFQVLICNNRSWNWNISCFQDYVVLVSPSPYPVHSWVGPLAPWMTSTFKFLLYRSSFFPTGISPWLSYPHS